MKTLYNTVQQCESILDPNQNQVMNRLTDDMIRNRIREYCTFDRQKYKRDELWPISSPYQDITRIAKDDKGWYIETMSSALYLMSRTTTKSFYDYYLSEGQKMDKQKGFLIEDIGVYFRWRKHNGTIVIMSAPNFKSTEGLPDEIDNLELTDGCCTISKKLAIHNKINVMVLTSINDIKISGNGCRDVIVHYLDKDRNVEVPHGTKIHRPTTYMEYETLRKELIGYDISL